MTSMPISFTLFTSVNIAISYRSIQQLIAIIASPTELAIGNQKNVSVKLTCTDWKTQVMRFWQCYKAIKSTSLYVIHQI